MPGRNDRCPCGSGKKYKKCCLGKDKANPIVPSIPPRNNPARPLPPGTVARSAPAPEPPPLDPLQEAYKRQWEDFKSRDWEGRIELFLGLLDDEEMLDAEACFEMLLQIHHDTLKCGEWQRFRELVETLQERRPELHEESALRYLSWTIRGAVIADQFDEVQPLALELGEQAGRDVDIFNRTFEEIAYHGHFDTLLEMLRLGWSGVQESDNILPWGISNFGERGVRYEIYHYLMQTSEPNGNDDALLDRVCFFIDDPKYDYLAQIVDTVAANNLRSWSLEDFEMNPPRKEERSEFFTDLEEEDEEAEDETDPGADNLVLLSFEFLGYLHREEGVSYCKGEIARKELVSYFVERHEGNLHPRGSMIDEMLRKKRPPKAPKPEHPLCPEKVTLDVHLGGLMDMFNGLFHRTAATFELIPAWLRFLQTRGLIDEDRRKRTIEQIMPLRNNLLKIWESSGEFSDLARHMQVWPETWKGE